jgi:uncharacterized lipoprotein YajG
MKAITMLLLFLLAALLLTCCTKTQKDAEPAKPEPVSITPSISLASVSPTSVRQFKDSIIFMVNYTDGDGDLGNADADSSSLFLTDARGNLTEGYYIQPLAPQGSNIAIKGTLKVKLDHTALLSTGTTTETTTYTIQMKDRAGHWSNKVNTGTITIVQ